MRRAFQLLIAGVVPAMLLALVGCAPPAFHIYASDVTRLQRGGGSAVILDDTRIIEPYGALVFRRGKRASQLVFAAVLVTGREGICFATVYPAPRWWRALRIERVDPRIAFRVIRQRAPLHIVRTADRSYEVRGPSASLRAWLLEHVRAVEDAHRYFVDLPEITYAVQTPSGWHPSQPDLLSALARHPSSLYDPQPSMLVGWRWTDLDRMDYFRFWQDTKWTYEEMQEAIRYQSSRIRETIEKGAGTGLVPGPCPLPDGGTWLLR
jgi:hypothetical protein